MEKLVHLYDKKTGAYTKEDKLIYPRYEEIKEMVDKLTIEKTEDEDGNVSIVNKPYQEEEVTGYKEVYDIPENATEVPLMIPNWKPVWDGEKWVETITKEELEEWNKPNPRPPSQLETKVEFLADQVAELKLNAGDN